MSKRGLKVKRSKKLYKKKKSLFRKVIEALALVVVVVTLGFVGFTVAETVLNYVPSGTSDTPTDVPTSEDTEPSEVESTTDPETYTDEPSSSNNGGIDAGTAVYAPSTVLESSAALSSYLAKAKTDGFSTVVIEMKDEEGKLLYKTGIEIVASDSEVTVGTLNAKQIADACIAAGLKPIARISTTKDHIAPAKIADVSYAGWLDDRPGVGRLWANPFLAGTVTYISEITSELQEAGFSEIIFANTIFPVFRGIDFQMLSPDITNPETRFTALGNLVNVAADDTPDANMLIEVALRDITDTALIGTAEILRNDGGDLDVTGVILVFSHEDFENSTPVGTSPPSTTDRGVGVGIGKTVKDGFAKAVANAGRLDIIPLLDRSNLSKSDLDAITEAFVDEGYENYIIRN